MSGGPDADVGVEEEKPRGTFVFLLLFLALIVALWAYTFLLLLDRG